MRELTATELLEAWERGRFASPMERALLLLCPAHPGLNWDELASLPVGERDARLLTLREWVFGPGLSSIAVCPACGERLELNFTVADVRTRLPMQPGPEDPLVVKEDGYEVRFRLPSTADLAALGEGQDARRELLRRCFEGARRGGKSRGFAQLPAQVLGSVARRMGEADPQADVHTRLDCPSCAHGWQVAFDIATYFWAEVEGWAQRLLRDVHLLATAYGWGEAEILALSPWRRQHYLQMVYR